MTKENFIREVCGGMRGILDATQLALLGEVVARCLENVELKSAQHAPPEDNTYPLKAFIAAKRVEGLSEKSLRYYSMTAGKMLDKLKKPVRSITTDDLRTYLGEYQQANSSSHVTLDNMRRVFSSFFGWLEDEDFILKSPVRRIHRVKSAKTVKETFSDENIESLLDNCIRLRDLAMVEMLISTGIRVGELVGLDRNDINFTERSCVVLGKGNAEREVYFDARTKLHLTEYLSSRIDPEPALFVTLRAPHERLGIGGAEALLKRLGERADVSGVHPHKFRRTLATMAIGKGMPIEQVQKLLGHARIDTTLHYAFVDQANVKQSHRKYIG